MFFETRCIFLILVSELLLDYFEIVDYFISCCNRCWWCGWPQAR